MSSTSLDIIIRRRYRIHIITIIDQVAGTNKRRIFLLFLVTYMRGCGVERRKFHAFIVGSQMISNIGHNDVVRLQNERTAAAQFDRLHFDKLHQIIHLNK